MLGDWQKLLLWKLPFAVKLHMKTWFSTVYPYGFEKVQTHKYLLWYWYWQNKCQEWSSLISKSFNRLYIGAPQINEKLWKGLCTKTSGSRMRSEEKLWWKVSSVGILLTNPDNMLVIQCKYHLQVRNPSPNVFGQHLSSFQTFQEVQENHCILLRLFPVCLPLPSWVLEWNEWLRLSSQSRNNRTSGWRHHCCRLLPYFPSLSVSKSSFTLPRPFKQEQFWS